MSTSALKIAFYGDDFTGATDTLATLTRGGQRALLFMGVPTAAHLAAAGPLDAIGIAGAARSMAPDAMRAELEPVGRFFAALKAPVVHYKVCSTFDSAPHVGSIGCAVQALQAQVGGAFVPVVGGQPSLGRHCVFGQLFAAAEAGGPVWRIDRHPTMSRHPVTPMNEADLRVHLSRQGLAPMAHVACTSYEWPVDEQEAALERLLAAAPLAVLFDVVSTADLKHVGRAIWTRARVSPLLVVGASSVAQALMAHWDEGSGDGGSQMSSPRAATPMNIAPADGPVLALAGSLSPLTARQVGAASSYRRLPIDTRRLIDGDARYIAQLTSEAMSALASGQSVLAHTAPLSNAACKTSAVDPLISGYSAHSSNERSADPALATACGALLKTWLASHPVRRVGIAGGDTSSLAVEALDIWGLAYSGSIAPGVALCRARSSAPHLDGVEFMLKGGQMGTIDLFERLLHGG
ncbi:MAG: type effector Hrp-dependent outer domain protein [Rhizobacter sp.]|nr:type effector Hrp-dependent outer domain protein [Rhizobacter sp.]